jgi:8-oxo-(d)GTP phosphatase
VSEILCCARLCRAAVTAVVLALLPASASWAADAALWRAVAGGNHVVLMRHAIAPGTGDPGNFRLGDCSTQRNLSQAGRDQAATIGALMRKYGVAAAQVYSSQWCRALETAKLLGLGPVTELPALNSFFSRGDGAAQTRTLRSWIAQQDVSRPLVLVTHQVNITALSDVYPASGEMVVMRRASDGTLTKVGSLRSD